MGSHPKTILKAVTLTTGDTERFFNPGLVPFLLRRRPRVALGCRFASRTPAAGWPWCCADCSERRWRSWRIPGWDGTGASDVSSVGAARGLQPVWRRVRGSEPPDVGDVQALQRRILDEQCFLSHLVADNDYFESRLADRQVERRFDVMFSGRIVKVKNPAFFAEVCAGIKARLGRCRVLVIGEGEEALKAQMRDIFEQHGVSCEFAGFIPHANLPDYYAQSPPAPAPDVGRLLGRGHQRGDARRHTGHHDGMDRRCRRIGPARAQRLRPASGRAGLGFGRLRLALEPVQVGVVLADCARRTVKEFNYDRAAAGILDAFAYLTERPSEVNGSAIRQGLAAVLPGLGASPVPASAGLLAPIGISFYTLQTIGYLIDVYYGRREPEKHFGIFAVFVCFFPIVVSGPIERAGHLLPQIQREHPVAFLYENISRGAKLIIWGFFLKLVIADRAALYVDAVFGHPDRHAGTTFLAATIFYSFQVYCDFAGYSSVAIGSAKLLGIDILPNFNRPYLALSVKDFWRRWHMTLSAWLRDYVFLPLAYALSRRMPEERYASLRADKIVYVAGDPRHVRALRRVARAKWHVPRLGMSSWSLSRCRGQLPDSAQMAIGPCGAHVRVGSAFLDLLPGRQCVRGIGYREEDRDGPGAPVHPAGA